MSRKVDVLGRIVIPAEIRKSLGLKEGSVLDISMDGESIVLASRQDECVFCDRSEQLRQYEGRQVCQACVDGLTAAPVRLAAAR